MACKCCHCDSSSESNTSNNSSASTSTGLISNNSMTLEEVKKALWMKYGIMIELRSLDEINDIYYLDRKYVFYRNKMLYKHVKEFTCYLKDILYRNYYWINSPYKMNAIYDNIRDDIRKGGYSKNTKYYIPISMDDGHNIKFYPDYVNFENKSFLHYFDMSWFTCSDISSTREYTKKIFEFFENNEEWTLELYFEGTFEEDYD